MRWNLWAGGMIVLLGVSCCFASPETDRQWTQFRGPGSGRSYVSSAQGNLSFSWRLNMLDPDDNGSQSDRIIFNHTPLTDQREDSPAAQGIAARVYDGRAYLFGIGHGYNSWPGRYWATVPVTDKTDTYEKYTGSEPQTLNVRQNRSILNAQASSGYLSTPAIMVGNFWGTVNEMWNTTPSSFPAIPYGTNVGDKPSLIGHATEGHRWLMNDFYLNGNGCAAGNYRYGHQLMKYNDNSPTAILNNRSVTASAWDDGTMVLFTRGGFSRYGSEAYGEFQDHYYVKVNAAGTVLANVAITGLYKNTGYYDPGDPNNLVLAERDNNVVHALAISTDGNTIFAQERPTATTQHIARRRIDDNSFSLVGTLIGLPTYTNNDANNGYHKDEMGISWAVDTSRFYLQTTDTLYAYSLNFDLNTDITNGSDSDLLWSVSVPARTLNASIPWTIPAGLGGTGAQRIYANRGTENTLATNGQWVFLTTDDRLQIRDAATGALLWEYVFTDLPSYESPSGTFTNGLPGDILLTDSHLFVLTHTNQSVLYAFEFVIPEPSVGFGLGVCALMCLIRRRSGKS